MKGNEKFGKDVWI